MKKILIVLFLLFSIPSFGQIIPYGTTKSMGWCFRGWRVDSCEMLPKINMHTQTRWKYCDSSGLIAVDSATGRLIYMDKTKTWSYVNTVADSAGNFIPVYQKANPLGVATLDSFGHVPSSQISVITTNVVYVDTTVAEMLAHTNPTIGTLSIRTDSSKTFVLAATPGTTYRNWKTVSYGGVISFNGRTGVIISRSGDYTTDSVSEGANNKYFTTARVQTVIYSDTPNIIPTNWTIHDSINTCIKKYDTTTKVVTITQLNDSLANRMTTNKPITLNGAVLGAGATTISTTLNGTGVVAGTYNNLTVGLDGRATSGSNTSYLTRNETIYLSGEVSGYGETAIAVHVDSQDHIVGSSATPSISAGAGAGSMPTVSLSYATDIAGYITVSTGLTPSTGAQIVRVSFSKPFYGSVLPKVIIAPYDDNTRALYGASQVIASGSSVNSFNITSGSVALTASTTYVWVYIVIQ